MTIWAAIGPDGSHWLMDIVVAVPFAVAIQSAFVTSRLEGARRTWTDVISCAALTAVWLIGFRATGLLLRLPTPAAWLAVVATVWWPLSRQRTAGVMAADHVADIRSRQAIIVASAPA